MYEVRGSEQFIVSDITYLKTDEGHAYLALATDPYLYYVFMPFGYLCPLGTKYEYSSKKSLKNGT